MDHEPAPLRDVVHRDPAAVRLDEPADEAEAEAAAGPVPGRAGPLAPKRHVEHPRQVGLRDPAAGVGDRQPGAVRARPPVTETVPSSGVYRTALSSRLATTRASSGSLARTAGQPDSAATSRMPRAWAIGAVTATASETTSPSGTVDSDSRSAPALIRDSSKRSSTSRVIRSVSTRIRRWYSATVSASCTTPSSRASAIARRPASGVRRSCDTQATRSRRPRSIWRSRSRARSAHTAAAASRRLNSQPTARHTTAAAATVTSTTSRSWPLRNIARATTTTLATTAPTTSASSPKTCAVIDRPRRRRSRRVPAAPITSAAPSE